MPFDGEQMGIGVQGLPAFGFDSSHYIVYLSQPLVSSAIRGRQACPQLIDKGCHPHEKSVRSLLSTRRALRSRCILCIPLVSL